VGEFFAQGGHAFGRHRVDRRIHSSAVFQTDENRVRNEREEMGRRAKREAVRRPSNVRGRGVGENERTLRERTRGVVDAGFESESEPVVRVAKFIEVPERMERHERGGGFGVPETQGNRRKDGMLEKRNAGRRRRRERGEAAERERAGRTMMEHT